MMIFEMVTHHKYHYLNLDELLLSIFSQKVRITT